MSFADDLYSNIETLSKLVAVSDPADLAGFTDIRSDDLPF